MARPAIEITDEVCEKAKTLASQGLTQKQIALSLGMGESTFYEKVERFPEFLEAIQVGKANGIIVITNALFQKAKDGDTPAIKYYLNNRSSEEWADRKEVDLTAKIVSHEDRLAHLK